MDIYNNKYARYNNLMTLFIGLYALVANILIEVTVKYIIMIIASVGWVIFLEKSKREYYSLLDRVARIEKREDNYNA